MVEKETSLSKIQRLISKQETIRNVATSAHIHHGKCISGDSRVLLGSGEVKTAKEIFEEVAQDGQIHEENENHTVYTPKDKVNIFSLNNENDKIEIKEVQYAWRLKGGNTLKITLRNGFEITTTLEHKYLVYRDDFVYVETKDLKIGDRVVSARKLDVNPKINAKEYILTKLSEKNFYINLKREFSSEIKEKILKYGIKNIKTSIKNK